MVFNLKQQRANVLIELAVVLPLFLLLLTGLISLGQLLPQYSSIQQTTFNAALHGSRVTEQKAKESMNQFATKLYALQNSWLKDESIHTNYDNPTDSVEVQIDSSLKMLTKGTPLWLHVRTYAPNLLVDNVEPGDLEVFENPAISYDCTGNPCSASTCPTSACP